VNIPHLGKFKYIIERVGTKAEVSKEPVFVWQDYFLEQADLSARSVPKGKLSSEEREVNYTTVAVLASLTKDQVVATLKALFAELKQRCADTKSQAVKVRFELPDVGRFCCDRGAVKFSFNTSVRCDAMR
jgi:hypothetical protein